MAYLLDTNVAWRCILKTDPRQVEIKTTVDALMLSGEKVFVTAQNLIEFRSVATRPLNANGLGFTIAEAVTLAREIEDLFEFLPDTPAIYPQWRTLVDQYGVSGRQVHDTRLVAVMLVNSVTHLLTLNPTDFVRFAEITVVKP